VSEQLLNAIQFFGYHIIQETNIQHGAMTNPAIGVAITLN
jgi:hypothetical protein